MRSIGRKKFADIKSERVEKYSQIFEIAGPFPRGACGRLGESVMTARKSIPRDTRMKGTTLAKDDLSSFFRRWKSTRKITRGKGNGGRLGERRKGRTEATPGCISSVFAFFGRKEI